MKTKIPRQDNDVFLDGEKLYGNDFSESEIEEWFRDEQEGYAELGLYHRSHHRYGYHKLNWHHGYSYLPNNQRFRHVLCFGEAYGEELQPISGKIDFVTLLDPSEVFSGVDRIFGIPCRYVKPTALGDLPFADSTFDLVTCHGVMHHIPNVSKVIKECSRCLVKDGVMLLREPISSMGDWRYPRPGLIKRERGIPLKLLTSILTNAGFLIEKTFMYVSGNEGVF
ncbi:MAG: class I SAM-dependent methyltransferase [Candidatus Competibacteraceae bacterium]|nr:MAG: class I SAM-dependent methyltransferase [Candidatus Competibacteraceae bacterium]